jgi:hypothetical protein
MTTRRTDILTAVFFIILSLILLHQLKGVPREGSIFPSFLLYALILCCALAFIRTLIPGFKNEEVIIFKDIPFFIWLMVVGLFVIYVVGVFNIGFFTSTFLVSWIVPSLLSQSHWRRAVPANLLFAAGATSFFYILFYRLLHVPFPTGFLM